MAQEIESLIIYDQQSCGKIRTTAVQVGPIEGLQTTTFSALFWANFSVDREAGAAASGIATAWKRLVDWLLWGPRQHESDSLWSLGVVSATSTGERTGKRP